MNRKYEELQNIIFDDKHRANFFYEELRKHGASWDEIQLLAALKHQRYHHNNVKTAAKKILSSLVGVDDYDSKFGYQTRTMLKTLEDADKALEMLTDKVLIELSSNKKVVIKASDLVRVDDNIKHRI